MIERLQRALEHVEELPPAAQEEVATLIEGLTEPLDAVPMGQSETDEKHLPKPVRDALALGGAWSDLQGDDEFTALDRIRHESKPSELMDEQLAWLDNDEEMPWRSLRQDTSRSILTCCAASHISRGIASASPMSRFG